METTDNSTATAAQPQQGGDSDSSSMPSSDPMSAAAQGMMDAGGQGNGAAPSTVNLPGGVQAAPKPAAQPQTPAAEPPPRTGIFDRMLELMGGGPKKTYAVNPDTGALEMHESQDTRGNLAKHVIAGMLTGLAAGAKERGPGAALRSFGAGAEASMGLADAKDEQKKIQAQKDADNQSAGMLRKAQIDRYNHEELMALRTSKRADQESFDRHMESQMLLTKNLHDMGAQLVPVVVNGKDINQGDTPNNDLDLMKAYTAGQVKAAPGSHLLLTTVRNDDGDMVHHVWNVPDDMLNQSVPITPDIRKFYSLPDSVQSAPLRQVVNLTAGMQDRKNNDINNQLTQERIATQKTEQQKNRAEAAAASGSANQADDFGNVSTLPPKELTKRQDTFQKDVVNKAYDVEKSYQMMQRAYGEYVDAAAKGQSLPTGAQSMLALSTHLATTFGNVKGSRVTKDMIREHLGARSIGDSALVAIQRLTNGDQLSSQQWKAFDDLVGQSRNETWKNAIAMAKDQKIGLGFLPRGNGQTPVDRNTAQLYVDAADGNMQKAADALKKRGWLLPSGGQ